MSNAVVKPTDQIAQYRDDFAQVLPSHVTPEQFVRVAQGALRRNPNLEAAARKNVGSLMSCLLDAARLGLEPGSEDYNLVPFNTKSGPEVNGIVGYTGIIELMYRAGVKAVHAELVCVNDQFEYQPGQDVPTHTVDWFGDRGEVRGAYAYATLPSGAKSKVAVVGPKEIARAMAESKGSDKPTSPWQKDYPAMVLKTAVRRLEKWVPTSPERLYVDGQPVPAPVKVPGFTPNQDLTPLPESSDDPPVVAMPQVEPATGEIVEGELMDPEDLG